ncbi:PqiC family protein [Pseudomonas syringae]|uniref:PqiC family protein n=1 Tax=Pseudomonas syringae TaxID=317 RepID=UPI0018E62BB4|nr:PqiC family protein [Pseudomonas syringae]MBI6743194.1 membrane integrity-associated transporter subunit PqiC [Pseudomonas syringae]MBI6748481.1 membrane integrity-associated transporter subunit PqiC [Pseudomonas syringae]MBI6763621.1 membrane integrity-associated transporter subunit PqiC [Pseudomonas syringae]MBI6804823.1 membrane integrity-associated transporter subunit PqiC [Pseudomonas syringae]MBI6826335.1 membrane integrity-associated transporter subunit PqiC [Pseudomonas syringae]
MTLRLKLMVLAAAVGLGACTSTQTHYYTLIAPMSSTSTAASKPMPFQFEMLPVIMPVQVDQPPLVVRQGNGSLAILDTERWGSPLGDEFHDALTPQLERRFGSRDMAGLPKNSDQPTLSIRTDVRRFESMPGNYALIDVVWTLGLREAGATAGSKRQSLTCSSVIREEAGEGMENLIIAHQKAVAQLADKIAATAAGWTAQRASRCL